MKNALFILVLELFLIHFASAQTQTEMNRNSASSLVALETELKVVLTEIKSIYKEDTAFISALVLSQKQWRIFRDAEIRMKYPKRAAGWYGSNHSMCLSLYKRDLTASRIEKLREWIEEDPEAEKDACAGSQGR